MATMTTLTTSFGSGSTPRVVPYSLSVKGNVTIGPRSWTEHVQTATRNWSIPEDCVPVEFTEMQYIPWNNPDNVVSAEAETVVRRVKNNLLVLLFLIGGPANVLNMAVFYRQGLGHRVNLCLFALALADETHLVMAVLCYGEQLYAQFTTKEGFGLIITFLASKNLLVFFASSFVSSVLSAMIATERCLCILSPLKFRTLLRSRTMATIIVVVTALVFGLYFVVVYRYRIACVYDPSNQAAEMTVVEGEFYQAHKQLIDHLDSFVFGVGVPGVSVVVVMIATVVTIVQLRRTVRWRYDAFSSISPREVALTKMLVTNSVFFIACVLPDAANRFSLLFLPEVNSGRRHHNLFLTGVWLGDTLLYVNATFNFVFYYRMGSRYRDTFWAMVGRKGDSGKGVNDTATRTPSGQWSAERETRVKV